METKASLQCAKRIKVMFYSRRLKSWLTAQLTNLFSENVSDRIMHYSLVLNGQVGLCFYFIYLFFLVIKVFFSSFLYMWNRHFLKKPDKCNLLETLSPLIEYLTLERLDWPMTGRAFKHILCCWKIKPSMAGKKLIVILITLNGPLSSVVTLFSRRRGEFKGLKITEFASLSQC